MNVRALELRPGAAAVAAEVSEVVQSWEAGDRLFWLDVEEIEAGLLASLLEELQVPCFLRERCLEVGKANKVVPTADSLFFEVFVFADADFTAFGPLAVLCHGGLVLTLHPGPVAEIQRLSAALTGEPLRETSRGGLLSELMLCLTRESARAAREIRASLVALDERMDLDRASVGLEEIISAKHTLLRIAAVTEEQQECFEAVADMDNETTAVDFSGLRGTLNTVRSAAGSAHRRANRLEHRTNDLQQRYELHQQEKVSHRLAVLTTLSAVFLPLTLLAGLWGMNFTNMPELQLPYGYPTALAVMVLVAAGCLWFFKARGWFDT